MHYARSINIAWKLNVLNLDILTLLSNSGSYSCSLWKCIVLTEKGFSSNQCYTEDEISSGVPFCSSFPDSCPAEVLVAWQTGESRQNLSCHCTLALPAKPGRLRAAPAPRCFSLVEADAASHSFLPSSFPAVPL